MTCHNKKGDNTMSTTDESLHYNKIQIVNRLSDFLRRNSGYFRSKHSTYELSMSMFHKSKNKAVNTNTTSE